MGHIVKILIMAVLFCPMAVLSALAADVTFDNNSPTVALGSTFNVQIIANLSPGDELAGGVIDLGYDDSVVEILNVAIEPTWDFLPDSGSKTGPGQWKGIGFDVFVNDPVSANAIVAVITLETRGLGSSPLSILTSSQFFNATIEIFPIITNAVITVADQTPPVVTAPASITLAADDATGTVPATDPAIQTFLNGATASDNVDGAIAGINITNDAPAQFAAGVTTVTFSAVDAAGNTGSAPATVTVDDLTPPVVTAPASIIVAAVDASGTPASDPAIDAFLNGATASDNVDGPIAGINITNDAPAQFAVGVTTVTFSAVDAAGNPASAPATVTVDDLTPPVVTAPASITLAADDATGTVPATDPAIQAFLNGATANDNVDEAIAGINITNDAPAQFAVGVTTVTFSAVDAAGNPASAPATVTVDDQTPPVVTAPASIIVAAVDASGTPASDPAIDAFLNGATASDNVDGPIAGINITNDAPAQFAVGVTTVTFSAVDAAGNPASAPATVTVDLDPDGDGVPPSLDNCSAVANADQRDTNNDGYGNLCDGDLNNDGSTNTLDLQLYKGAHNTTQGQPNYDPDADFNGDGIIDTQDLSIYEGLHRKPPGPSCCGT